MLIASGVDPELVYSLPYVMLSDSDAWVVATHSKAHAFLAISVLVHTYVHYLDGWMERNRC